MVTGDNIQTAKAIAAECGILTEGGSAIEGKEFRAMTVVQQYKVIPSIDVQLHLCTLLSVTLSCPWVLHTIVQIE
jgi:magnesium-transporting ATPase (P-type)